MTGRRLKVIAAQAVVVGALLIVVSLTLLRPNDGANLFDIVAPGGSDVSVGPAEPGSGSGDDRREGEARSSEARGGDTDPALGAGSASAALPSDENGSAAPPPLRAAPPSSGDESPADDQYGGTVARLSLATE